MTAHKKTWRGLQPQRVRKADLAPRLPEIADHVVKACYMMLESGEIERFSDKQYMAFIAMEIIHGDAWRKARRIVDIDTAKIEILEVHKLYERKYELRLEKMANDDGIDRRMVQEEENRLVIARGVNFTTYADSDE